MSDEIRESGNSDEIDQAERNGVGRSDGAGKPDMNDRRSDFHRPRTSNYRSYFRKKVCKFCKQNTKINYLDTEALRRFTTARGRILPSRITGNCAKHQRALARAIKRARVLAMLPFSTR